jgi:2-methylisocitrate lyase-like PEP mutase family enzyme
VNADFESGFALDAAGIEDSVRHAVETGVAGLSIEDSTGDAAKPLYDLCVAVERIGAARKAIYKAGGSVGGALARSAWGGFMRAARLIAEQGKSTSSLTEPLAVSSIRPFTQI